MSFQDFLTYIEEKKSNETTMTAPPTTTKYDAAKHEISMFGFKITPFEGIIFVQLIVIWVILVVWLLQKMWKRFLTAITSSVNT